MGARRDARYFINLAADVLENGQVISAGQLLIWGGILPVAEVAEFVADWDPTPVNAFRWALVEEVSRFYLSTVTGPADALPDNLKLLERIRIFGPGGDLDLRRDGDVFHWRFLGVPDGDWPELGLDDRQDFWLAVQPTPTFRAVERTYFQWRPDDLRASNHWRDETPLAGKDVTLRQVQYLENGRVAFVRYVDLAEADNG